MQVDDEALYVSNYRSEVRIPFTEVSHFTQTYDGIQRRALIAWKLGWVVLAASFVSFVATGLPVTLQMPPPGSWIVSCFFAVGGTVVTVAWGFWW